MACEISVPLEKRMRATTKGARKQLCLHPQWMFHMRCITYEPTAQNFNAADVAEWHERLQFLVNDFRELLSLEFSQFWCQVIFEPTVMPSVNSYLKAAPRPYDLKPIEIPDQCSDLHDELHRSVFLVLLRLSTYKESKTDFITSTVFGDIVYDNYIFDITKLLDICSLYGHANHKLVTKMIENIFQCQPKYKTDLLDWFTVMRKVFEKFREDCKFSPKSGSPQKLGHATEHLSELELIDRLLYAADAISSLDTFLQIASFLAEDFLKNGFEQLIVHLYEDLVPHFEEEIRSCNFKREADRQLCRRALKRYSEGSLSVYRRILFPSCLGPLLDSQNGLGQNHVEVFTNTTLNILGHRRFVAALERRFPFAEDLGLIRQSGHASSIDDAQADFICNAAESARREFSSDKQGVTRPFLQPSKATVSGNKGKGKKNANKKSDDMVYADEPDCTARLTTDHGPTLVGTTASHPDLPLLISAVSDILPDLGSGFIEACLEEYQYSSEQVVNAILEGSLPSHLEKLDRQFPQLSYQPQQPPGVNRHSVFDGDEFDHKMGKPLDMSRIHQGKRDVAEELPSVEERKQLLNQYGTVCEESEDVLPGTEDAEYDDEFDDTYDSHLSSVDDAKDAILYRRQWVVPRALRGKDTDYTSEEQSCDDAVPQSQKDSMDEVLTSNGPSMGRRGSARMGHNPRPDVANPEGATAATNERTYDVRGRGRGRGQSHEVTHNRLYKERHKGHQGNHNRRNLADKKRQRTGFY